MPENFLPTSGGWAPRRWLIPGVLLGAYASLIALRPGAMTAVLLLVPPVALSLAWWVLLRPSRWFAAFAAATLLLPPLPFDLGNTGPHPALLFAALGIWAGMTRLQEWRIANDRLTVALLVFLLLLFASVPFALFYSGGQVAAGSLARVLLFAISVYAYFYFAHGPGRRDGNALWWTRLLCGFGIAAALLACIDFYFQFPPVTPFSPQFVWLPDRILRRAQGFFYDATMLGNLCAFFLIMIALVALRPDLRNRVLSKKALALGAVLFSAALIFSFSRASLLNLFAALAVMSYLNLGELRKQRALLLVIVGMAAALLFTALAFPAFVESYLARLWATATGLFSSPETLLSGRWQTWRDLWAFLWENPLCLLTGIGFKTLPYSNLAGGPIIADNMYFSILVETGLLGFAALLFLLSAILRTSYRAARSPHTELSFLGTWTLCFWVGQLFQMLAGDVLTYWRVLPLYFAILGLTVREAEKSAETDPPAHESSLSRSVQ